MLCQNPTRPFSKTFAWPWRGLQNAGRVKQRKTSPKHGAEWLDDLPFMRILLCKIMPQTLRLFEGPSAFRRQKNVDVGNLKGRISSDGHDSVSNWIEENAGPLLRDGLGPERVRGRLCQIAAQIQSPEAEPLRSQLLQAMNTPQSFHQRLVTLGLIEAQNH